MAGRIAVDEPPAPSATGTASRSSSPTAAGWRCATSAGSAARCSSRTSPTSARTPPRSARDAFRERVGRGTAPLKARLLDQGVIAGVGNLLADETLWRARLSPRRPAGELDRRGARPPAPRAARRDARRDPQGRRPHRRASSPHRERGGACPRCGTDARARDDRRPDDVLVPDLPAGGRRSVGDRALSASLRRAPHGARGLVVAHPGAAQQVVAVERTWPTITLTDRLPVLLEHVRGAVAAARSAGARAPPSTLRRVLERRPQRAHGGREVAQRVGDARAGRSRRASSARIAPRASTRTLRTARSIWAAAIA